MAARRTSRSESKPHPAVRSRQPRKPRRRDSKLAFEALTIEGGLLSPDWLARVAALEAAGQNEADYRIPKGLQLRDEIGRYWRIAQAYWSDFASGRSSATKPEAAQALSERFILALLRESFGFSSLTATEPLVVTERRYPIGVTALGGRVPVVIAPAGSGLDTLVPAFGDGSRRRSAFGLAQEYLNAAENATWGLATDGLALRILRDNASLTRPAWIEADLARIFTEERYSDFAALWLLAHETRFGRADQPSTECMLDTWRDSGREEGTRAREHLRRGVEEALVAFGQGFLIPENTALRAALQDGSLSPTAYFQELLRLVYRLIFLLTVEERGLLHPEGSAEGARRLYEEGYGLRRLRERSIRRSVHDRFSDLWEATKIVFRGLAAGESRLALPALAGIFSPAQCPMLDAAKLENRALLLAIFHLSWLRESSGLVRVNWRDMGPEELGSVYESLLELVPQVTQGGRLFAFATGGESKGNARKTSGSYYTPDSLVQVLLDNALEPVIASTLAVNPERPAEALLDLSVVDPACGSGHFLLAAARRLAVHVARFQANGTPSATEYRHALRQVVGRCLYGVDLNPMAVELCKVSLWMEAVEPGLPLTFLNAHIRHGNALLGTTPELIADGIPDTAWEPIEGDDRNVAGDLKKRNKRSEGGQRALDTLWTKQTESEEAAVARAVADLEAAPDTDFEALAHKEERWEGLLDSDAYRHQKLVADAWCAAFVWPKQPGPFQDAAPTNDVWIQIRDRRGQPNPLTVRTTKELAAQYQFFHWHLAFPHVFALGGFDVVLGNPPWERVRMEEVQFFANRAPEIAVATTSVRTQLISRLAEDEPDLAQAWAEYCRLMEGTSSFIRRSRAFPLTGRGKFNLSALFAERAAGVLGARGVAGIVVPTAVATDEAGRLLFSSLVAKRRVVGLYDFENALGMFPDVDSRYRFCLLVASGISKPLFGFDCAFGLTSAAELHDLGRRMTMTADDIASINPNSRTCPVIKRRRDLDILRKCHGRHPVLVRHDPLVNDWSATPTFMFQMSDPGGAFVDLERVDVDAITGAATDRIDSSFFQPLARLYEAKLVHQFDHRFATFRGLPRKECSAGNARELLDIEKADPDCLAIPRYWLPEVIFRSRIRSRPIQGDWLLSYREITNATNARTLLAAFIPLTAAGRKIPQIYLGVSPRLTACFLGILNSFVLDFVTRCKLSGTSIANFLVEQLPIPEPSAFAVTAWCSAFESWIARRVLELTYTAWDLEPFAHDMGYDGPPFRWDPERRFLLRAELDAAFFHLYGLSREDTAYILDTFPIVRKNDEKAHGEYRTKRVILETYDAMAEAARTGQPYATRLDPPPAALQVAHPPRTGVVVPLPSRPLALPAWGHGLFAEVAARAQVRHEAGAWGTSLSGAHLGMTGLAAVLRNLPGPRAREEVESAVVLALLPRLMLPNFDNTSAKTWRSLIGSENLGVTSIAAFEIPWSVVIREAIKQDVLAEEADGRWGPGPDVADAFSPEFEARALVVLSWLATAPKRDAEVTKQMENLYAA